MIFTSSSATSFPNHRLQEKINTKCQFSSRHMLPKNANFSSLCLSPISWQMKATKSRKRCSSPTTCGGDGGLILWRMFINYSCLQAQCTIVLSKTLTFSILLRFGASYKVHWEKEASTLRMIWRAENTTFIYYLSSPAEGKASRGAVIPEWLM